MRLQHTWLVLIFVTSHFGCSSSNTDAEVSTAESRAKEISATKATQETVMAESGIATAKKIAEDEVRKRERWEAISSRGSEKTDERVPDEKLFFFIVSKVPAAPGSVRYVTIVNDKIVDYQLGK